jgi:translation initiation factor 3 subunit H
MQHARDSVPSLATGQLLGMDKDSVLEITESFPFATNIQDEFEQEEYQLEMMRALRDVNIDHNTVGWYQSCSMDSFVSQSFIEAQFNYQSTIATSIVFVYDQLRSSQGPPAIKALRLKEDFMNLYRDKKTRSYDQLVGMNILEELPVKISLSSLEQLFIADMVERNTLPPAGSLPIIRSEQLMLSMAAENLVSAADDVCVEAGRLQHYLRSVVKQQQALGSQLQRLVCKPAFPY